MHKDGSSTKFKIEAKENCFAPEKHDTLGTYTGLRGTDPADRDQ